MRRVLSTLGFLLVLLALGCSVAQADTVTVSSVTFFTAGAGGGFDVRATSGGLDFLWSFATFGAQLFSGTLPSPTVTLLTGSFPINPVCSATECSTFSAGLNFGSFSGGTIDASAVGGTINYAITGKYALDVPVSAFSSPGSFFSLSFGLPQSPSGLSCLFMNCFTVTASAGAAGPIVGSVTTTPIPEPGTLLLLGTGLLGLARVRRRFLC